MHDIDTLCFSGGGMKGGAFFGALSYLEKNNHINMKKIKTFVGCSIGGICAFYFALGYTIDEIIEFIMDFNFSNLEPDVNCENIFINYGLSDNNKLGIVMSHFIKNKFNKTDLTFYELYTLTGNKLIINGANISDSKGEFFDHILTPDMSVITALMISSCVPIVFNPILYNDKYYVDGGISNAFPIEICNKNTTLGFYIQTTNRKIDSLASVALASLSLLMQEPFKKYDNSYSIINFNNIDIGCVDFSVSNELKQKIFDMGMKEAEIFIAKYNEKTISSDVNDDKQLVEVIINIL